MSAGAMLAGGVSPAVVAGVAALTRRPAVTGWFHRHSKPWEPGLYQRETINGPIWAVWDGENWRCGSVDKGVALSIQLFSGAELPWRGRSQP